MWKAVGFVAELESKGRILVREGTRQIAVFMSQGEVYALDNRCPHEGYPLLQGALNAAQCSLTCHWHNWKFDLKNGKALVGQDSVRTYPARIEAGQVWLDFSPPDRAQRETQLKENLRQAFEKRQYGRLSRELARLDFEGFDPVLSLRDAIFWSHAHLEFGFGHAYAAAADWIQLADRSEKQADRLIALTEALDHLALDVLREPVFPYSQARSPYASQALQKALENEEEAQAQALLNDALARGLHFAELEETLAEFALSHYLDFGHSLIYLLKTRELIQRLGSELEGPLLKALVRSLCFATREELLPAFRAYAPALAKLQALPEWGSQASPPEPEALLGASPKAAFEWLFESAKLYRPEAIYQSLLAANAHSLLSFDLRFQAATENPVSENMGWLDLTHALTFAQAVHQICRAWPQLWPQGLLQLAAFYGRNTPYLTQENRSEAWFVADPERFWAETDQLLLDHGLGVPIFSAHLLKTSQALRSEYAALDPRFQAELLAGLNRFLHSPIKQRHARRTALQSLALVGKDIV
ncbi:hypothetical protein COW36_12730 [bacterium (Candidatus Blackallbacteria) CG17_big_fil_post_rev_8_21_14_2_50_48_46]|uniref:Rieske domain-containing protein n=1 Tax=bacterium (Candidatus Blackallbacteria) CG17_big_fil_post_rev_8_21_14_2_50_48_46 TaxID=2014261 RepID=A0A2M7G414_9BACT|nr:MAG: hypothetical protein COW64_02530 [bacterium (Candidatus Blackallbacteria) CG18_big_fil_WC_8_21_14_2_50_49_26]PIW16626.1 MAG: hypothetical protein COW36_12730 [bacterium (Candidatus Blackallbacteria) CG17_big_fil_post_rev_8_21_14_2_50_48_46]PIW46134.1 MAG: hypothetical protein COW20_17995 [bacterium (Candidatus Blackallbacteria) CG13_big_fil_rev_8_21_14_2_50_49_14]